MQYACPAAIAGCMNDLHYGQYAAERKATNVGRGALGVGAAPGLERAEKPSQIEIELQRGLGKRNVNQRAHVIVHTNFVVDEQIYSGPAAKKRP